MAGQLLWDPHTQSSSSDQNSNEACIYMSTWLIHVHAHVYIHVHTHIPLYIYTYMFQFQENGEGKWIVDSISRKTPKGYRVEQLSERCTHGDPLQPTCTKEVCQFLCRHMFQCAMIFKMDTSVNCVRVLRTMRITQTHALDEENCFRWAQSDQDTDSDIDMVFYVESHVPLQHG